MKFIQQCLRKLGMVSLVQPPAEDHAPELYEILLFRTKLQLALPKLTLPPWEEWGSIGGPNKDWRPYVNTKGKPHYTRVDELGFYGMGFYGCGWQLPVEDGEPAAALRLFLSAYTPTDDDRPKYSNMMDETVSLSWLQNYYSNRLKKPISLSRTTEGHMEILSEETSGGGEIACAEESVSIETSLVNGHTVHHVMLDANHAHYWVPFSKVDLLYLEFRITGDGLWTPVTSRTALKEADRIMHAILPTLSLTYPENEQLSHQKVIK
ncbi:hypothetical protein [Marinibactrum halimedae]|uniref:Uncharacterized protein n=1 Tax=Marinibactrum halimedae TaxID=1444977 RepID=A0AA37WMN0_9GAMM|nr:hypothetical protein [Marinibactrum halimedae]MCD9458579.1 hypothetical protein [Marinibactrum halimedae]GLS26553.1 hypothetical protein GCM10007877_22690 [Marinibactrum halimedae]